MQLPDGTEYEQLLRALSGAAPWATALVKPPGRDHAPEALPAPPSGLPPLKPTLTETIDQFADLTPQQVALSDPAAEITYRELRERGLALTAQLRAAGVRRGDVVLLVQERSARMVECMLALWRLGAAFVPIDPYSPDMWRERIARISAATTVLTVSGLPGPGEDSGMTRIDVDLLDLTSGAGDEVTPGTGSDLAYAIRTSGTSGMPKLAAIEHSGLHNLVQGVIGCVRGLGQDAVVIHMTPPYFDAMILDVLIAVTTGSRLEIAKPRAGAEVLRERAVTHAVLPAALVRTMHPDDFPCLRVLLSVGDVCLTETARLWTPYVEFMNGYGPTETTVCASIHPVAVDDHISSGSVPLGHPMPGVGMTVVDRDLRPVPAGTVGEILISGLGVGRGYLGDPAGTAARFATDPVTGQRTYRSGDLGRVDIDGLVHYLGRGDRQAKIRGYRVEPAEVEAELAKLAGVQDAIVVVDTSVTGSRLIGYAQAVGVTGESLRTQLAQVLPEYLVPSAVVVLDGWPLSENGKVDRSKLPRPQRNRTTVQPPRGQTEATLTRVAACLLGVEHVSADDTFVTLGGHSLLAAQLVARIRLELGQELDLGAVMRGDTVRELAASLRSPTEAGPQWSDEDTVPSYSQHRVWLVEQMNPGSIAYHAQSVLLFDGPLDVAALETSLTGIVARHDAFRFRLPTQGGELTCAVAEPWRIVLHVTDFSDADDAETRFANVVRAELSARFDFEHGPLVRWRLVRMAAEQHVLLYVEHHAVHDGMSYAIFLRELVDGYAAALHGQAPPAAPPLRYSDYALWQRKWSRSAEADQQRAFWRTTLAGVKTISPLEPEARRPVYRRMAGAAPRLDIDAALTAAVRRLGRAHGASLYMTMLAAFFTLLHRRGGHEDLLVASGVAARRWANTHNVIGMFVNTVAVRARPAKGMLFTEFLAQVRTTCLDAYDNQELPFEEVLAELELDRIPGLNPLVQVMFSFHDTPLPRFERVPLDITALPALSNGSAKFDLGLVTVPRYASPGRAGVLPGGLLRIPASEGPVEPAIEPSGLTIVWEYDTDLFTASFIAELMDEYAEVLRTVTTDPEFRLRRNGNAPRPAPATTRVQVVADHVTRPLRPEQAALTEIALDLLDVPEIVADDNFYAFGADSLTIIRFAARARERFGISIPMPEMLREPSVATALRALAGSPVL